MRPKHKRLIFVVLGVGILGVAAALILNAMNDALVFFHTPSEVFEHKVAVERRLRVGGLVEAGSVVKGAGANVSFRVTDLAHDIPVVYRGILPDLFREGQGVVVEGRLQGGVFVADQVLAKHDERYMPPEAAEALKKSGQWQHMREDMQAAGQIPENTQK